MAGIRQFRGKWYIRVFNNGQEKLIPTQTYEKAEAMLIKANIEEDEEHIKAMLFEPDQDENLMLDQAIAEYISDCDGRIRPKTMQLYERTLNNLLECWGNLEISKIAPKHVAALGAWFNSRVSPVTANIRMAVVKAFLNWLVQTWRIDRFPGKIRFARPTIRLSKFFKPDELERILKQKMTVAMRACFQILAATGMRRGELANSMYVDGFLILTKTKNGRDRMVPLPDDLVVDYLMAIGSHYHPDYMSSAFGRAVRLSGIEKNGRSLHSLRHTYALREYWRTKDIHHVSRRLGHAHIRSTDTYVSYPLEYLEQVFGNTKSTGETSSTETENADASAMYFQSENANAQE